MPKQWNNRVRYVGYYIEKVTEFLKLLLKKNEEKWLRLICNCKNKKGL